MNPHVESIPREFVFLAGIFFGIGFGWLVGLFVGRRQGVNHVLDRIEGPVGEIRSRLAAEGAEDAR